MKTDEQNKDKAVLNDAKIQELKKQWGKIFMTKIGDDVFVWRKLRRKEYVDLMVNTEKLDDDMDVKMFKRQEEIAKLCVLYPENIDELIEENCGIATVLSDEIILRSGFYIKTTEEL
jgi:hypothetical protein